MNAQTTHLRTNTPPSCIDIEKKVLGVMLLKKTAVPMVLDNLSSKDFFIEKHSNLFELMERMFNNGNSVDMSTVCSRIMGKGEYPTVSEMADFTGSACYLTDIDSYSEEISEKAKRRSLIAEGQTLVSRCYADEDFEEVVNDFSSSYFETIAGAETGSELIGDIIPRVVKDVTEKVKSDKRIFGLETGLHDYDKITGGYQPEKLYILAARPAMGKSSMAVNNALHVALHGGRVSVFSLEMPKDEIVARMITQIARVNGLSVRDGLLTDDELRRFSSAADSLKHLDMVIDATPGLTLTQIKARSTMHHARGKLDLIVVDYIQLMTGQRGEPRERQIAMISGGLKGLSKDLHVPVLALSQLNRSLESRTDRRPIMSDLRESGAIEQDADAITFIYRDEVYNKDASNPAVGLAELIVCKNRGGKTGTSIVGFDGSKTEFYNIDSMQEERYDS